MPGRSLFQSTVADSISISGIGVHSGLPATVTIHPGDEDTGIVFLRTDLGALEREIKAVWSAISTTSLCTVLGDPKDCFVSTVEHLLSALSGLGIDNALIEIDGPEVPIMDGSAAPFIDAIDGVGLIQQRRRKKALKVLKPVRVEIDGAFGELSPAASGCEFDVSLDYDDPSIGQQRYACVLSEETFRLEVSRARTFGFLKDVETLWAANFAKGSSLENAVVIGDEGVINPEGLRFENEFVRHKLLDAVGDLSLAGMPLQGRYRSHKGGHRLNFSMLKTLFSDPTAYEIIEADASSVENRVRRQRGEVNINLAAATLRPVTA
ncbi:MAG: UDP-3-O-acyl-N-acetylglucosamine deacetylase [Pseudomonadota bacterium]